MTEFNTVTQVRKSIFLRGQSRPHSKGAGLSVPVFWNPYLRSNGLTIQRRTLVVW